MAHQGSTHPERVLRFIDRDGEDLILYEPSAAARAKTILALAESISTWGDLRRVRESRPSELVDPIVQYLWEQWKDPDQREWVFEVDENDVNPPDPQNVEQLLVAFPDDKPLSVPVDGEDGPTFMDPFDSALMGVPSALDKYYIEQSTMVSMWHSPPSEDLPSIRHDAEGLGWRVEEGSYNDLPHY
jgi:hypothetical protein